MLDWLKVSPGFPVFETPDSENREAGNPRACLLSRFSRSSRLENRGGTEKPEESAPSAEKNRPPISNHIPAPFEAVAAHLGRLAAEDLQTQAAGDAERMAELCRLVLAAPPSPTPDEIAELDSLMVRLCDLEPWLAGYLPEMQSARRSMAPANVAESLACFRQYVREAEARRGAVLGAEGGELPRPKPLTVAQATATDRKGPAPLSGSS